MDANYLAWAVLILFGCNVLTVTAVVSSGVRGVWLWGYQYRDLERRYGELLAKYERGVATTRAAADTIESRIPDYQDHRYLVPLWRQLAGVFSEGELQDICFELGVEYENLAAASLKGRARELIEHLKNTSRVSELVVIAARERPGLDWANPEGRWG